MLAEGTTRCGEASGDEGSGCPRENAGLGLADSGVCSVTGDEDEFADIWALALKVSSNETVITQPHIRIKRPRFDLAFVDYFEKQRFSGARARGDAPPPGKVPPRYVLRFAEHWRKK
jgi:hypothetical protein